MNGDSGTFPAAQTTIPGRQLFEELRLRPGLRLQIGDHLVDVGALRIATRQGTARLIAKDMTLLIELVRHRGETMSHAHLLRQVWGKDGESHHISIRVAIAKLRRALGDARSAPRYIETIPCVGYRLIAPVMFLPADDPPRFPSIRKPRLPGPAIAAGLSAGAGA
ncbi:MAG: helix-turn-helix domain-containing protein [Rudaea sp.]|uniref:winged helix-turn-helix domain-containing protein n=1 Tax=Rudaea sp. TaxID=2136325 RepID=UPI0039E27E34